MGQLTLRYSRYAFASYGIDQTLHGKYLNLLSKCFDEGKLKPFESVVLEFDQMREAHKLQATGHTIGKIVVKMI